MFRPRPLCLLALLCLALPLSAQIALDLQVSQQRYLRYEPIRLTLTVHNLSGNTLEFDTTKPGSGGRIAFKVDTASGRPARLLNPLLNPAQGLLLAPGESRAVEILLNQHYDMQREDGYTVQALLDHDRLPRRHISPPVRVEVQDGLPILVKNIGLPTDRATGLIKTIQLSLLRFADVEEDIYALRAEDDENVYAVHRLGSFIDGEAPQLELDGDSLVHVLLQIRPRLYVYYIFGFEGRNPMLRQKRFYVSADGMAPSLNRETGYLRVIHGQLAREGIDYYEPKED